jgi:hypothetical protein
VPAEEARTPQLWPQLGRSFGHGVGAACIGPAQGGTAGADFGELYRNGTEWKFRAVGQGSASGLAGIDADFGVNV